MSLPENQPAATVETVIPGDPPPPPPKKVGRRKPIWVLIRIDPAAGSSKIPVEDAEGMFVVYKCTGVEQVRKRLTMHLIDARNIDERVIFLRADPVDVTIKTQLLIRF